MTTPFLGRVIIAVSICAAYMATVQAEPERESRWTRQLSSSNAAEADQAALKSFQDGRNSLHDLMILLDDDSPFAGKFL